MPERAGSNISFLDNSFNQENTPSYTLSIQIGSFRITCFFYDASSNIYLGFISREFSKEVPDHLIVNEMNQIIEEFDWMANPFDSVLLLFDNPYNTLVPLTLFDESDSDVYLRFNQAIDQGAIIRYDVLKNNESVNVYSVNKELYENLLSRFPEATAKHFSSVFIEAITINYKNLMDDNSIYMNVREGAFDLLCFSSKRLRFYNLFKYKTKEDLIYFLLAALEEMSLNPEEIRLHLTGLIEKGDRLYEIIFRYIRNVEIIGKNETYNYAPVMEKGGDHKLFVLYNLPLCV